MPPLLIEADVRTHVETDLTAPALQRLIDDADAAIVSRFGAHASAGTVTERHSGYVLDLFPFRPVGAVTTITERSGSTDTVLAVNDWESLLDGRALRRLGTGTNQRGSWAERVTIVYTPKNDDAQRKRILVDLVKLANRYEAVKSENAGDYSAVSADYQDEREAILAELAPALDFA